MPYAPDCAFRCILGFVTASAILDWERSTKSTIASFWLSLRIGPGMAMLKAVSTRVGSKDVSLSVSLSHAFRRPSFSSSVSALVATAPDGVSSLRTAPVRSRSTSANVAASSAPQVRRWANDERVCERRN